MRHTAESLKRMALRTGSVVEINGSPFNAGRAIAPYVEPKAPPAPTPKPDVTPQIAAHLENIARAVAANAAVNSGIQQAISQIKPEPQAERPRKWVWVFHRNARGLIERIEATSE